MPSASLPTVEYEWGKNPTHSVIWMHGLGADGYDFHPFVPQLQLPAGLSIRFVFPHAPAIPVTLNGGYVMPAWYDILSIEGIDRHIDTAGIEQSMAAVRQLIAAEVERGIPEHNIMLAGFSQGGVISVLTGLTHPRRLGGIIALSTYLPAREHWTFADANRSIPIFVAHGRQDPVVPYVLGQQLRDLLRDAAYTVEWHDYAMPHSVCPQEIHDISAWLQRQASA